MPQQEDIRTTENLVQQTAVAIAGLLESRKVRHDVGLAALVAIAADIAANSRMPSRAWEKACRKAFLAARQARLSVQVSEAPSTQTPEEN